MTRVEASGSIAATIALSVRTIVIVVCATGACAPLVGTPTDGSNGSDASAALDSGPFIECNIHTQNCPAPMACAAPERDGGGGAALRCVSLGPTGSLNGACAPNFPGCPLGSMCVPGNRCRQFCDPTEREQGPFARCPDQFYCHDTSSYSGIAILGFCLPR
jgi:hypothetical protein